MRYQKLFLTLVFALFISAGAFVISADAQSRRTVIRRPVVVYRPVYVRPYWGSRYYDPFYRSFYQTPYERYREELYYAQRELAGNQRELAEHREKYSRDGVITAKERRELEDDVRDVARARERLARLSRYY